MYSIQSRNIDIMYIYIYFFSLYIHIHIYIYTSIHMILISIHPSILRSEDDPPVRQELRSRQGRGAKQGLAAGSIQAGGLDVSNEDGDAWWITGYLRWFYGGFHVGGTPKSSILMKFALINQPFWGIRCFMMLYGVLMHKMELDLGGMKIGQAYIHGILICFAMKWSFWWVCPTFRHARYFFCEGRGNWRSEWYHMAAWVGPKGCFKHQIDQNRMHFATCWTNMDQLSWLS